MPENDLLLKAGNVLIQGGNNHTWSNRGNEPCVVAKVLINGVIQLDAPDEEAKGVTNREKSIFK
jgi:hypothetical protein